MKKRAACMGIGFLIITILFDQLAYFLDDFSALAQLTDAQVGTDNGLRAITNSAYQVFLLWFVTVAIGIGIITFLYGKLKKHLLPTDTWMANIVKFFQIRAVIFTVLVLGDWFIFINLSHDAGAIFLALMSRIRYNIPLFAMLTYIVAFVAIAFFTARSIVKPTKLTTAVN